MNLHSLCIRYLGRDTILSRKSFLHFYSRTEIQAIFFFLSTCQIVIYWYCSIIFLSENYGYCCILRFLLAGICHMGFDWNWKSSESTFWKFQWNHLQIFEFSAHQVKKIGFRRIYIKGSLPSRFGIKHWKEWEVLT